MGVSGRAIKRTAERFGDSEWVEGMGRAGLVAKGISFGIVGVLALLLASGAGGTHEGGDLEGWTKRAGCLLKGVFYAGLSLLAASFLTGPRGESASEPERTARIFELPLGRWVVAIAGLGLIVYGLWNGYRSFSGKFRKHLKTHEMERKVRPLVNVVGFLGHLARMVLFSMVGVFLLRAAYQYDPEEAIGFDGALAKLADQPGGLLWLAAAAAGLFAYGAFSIAQARYRDI